MSLLQRLCALALVIYVLVLSYFILTPAQELPTINLWDKGLHFAAYLNLMLLCLPLCNSRRALHLALLLVLIYSGATELAQGFIPGRDSSLLDLLANTLGSLLAYAAGRWFFLIGSPDKG